MRAGSIDEGISHDRQAPNFLSKKRSLLSAIENILQQT